MDDPDTSPPEPANLRFLRRLVTVLTAVMIGGMCIIIVLIVIRFSADPVPLPDRITLPEGASAVAFTQGPGWYAVVTDDNRILVFDADRGGLRQEITVDVAP